MCDFRAAQSHVKGRCEEVRPRTSAGQVRIFSCSVMPFMQPITATTCNAARNWLVRQQVQQRFRGKCLGWPPNADAPAGPSSACAQATFLSYEQHT